MVQRLFAASVLVLSLSACQLPFAAVPSSKNAVVGEGMSYLCPLADGSVQFTLSDADLPACTPLTDLPPAEASAIENQVKEQNSNILPPGTIAIDRSGI